MNAKALNIKSNHRHNCKVIGLKDVKHVRYFFKSIPLDFLNEAYMIIVFSKVGRRQIRIWQNCISAILVITNCCGSANVRTFQRSLDLALDRIRSPGGDNK